ncbi:MULTISPECIES: 2Fe-2S iron-sulfur cluster-binding protein [Sphingomonadaceae]|uniref:2Fe-2S ferredoxin n=3 Tax=Sphingobium TaxID=165695 RepID=A0A418YPA6_9SPHN|nr:MULTISPECIES: 2Fe-2S iron-sulfur cluster-binding protein [Sphingomonadaceae]EXS68625.1 2Fe-2S ferredoxin [Sphingobium sp. Ant17]MDH7970751.1 2Fe-2S iron-sulfur cluster-binding protein [Sphingomonas sp. AR_OL41]QNG43979.1 2Fe-2S iron-sulfur cluster binding domain-containing protein [Sphingobium yanoikuyae]QOT72237.1 2Fe-2S iron-sulfur cluster binding domain-containing protein [Sphingobium fuliginis]RJG53137.1 2Fe-2S ferredoxin [Sphingobium terrigena]
MTKITFIEFNGTERSVDAENGQSLMRSAVDNLVPGIDGDCGGACACATCHCYIEGPLAGKLPEIGEAERSMLEMVEGVTAASRLACQITVSGDLEGLVVRTPQSQH